MLVEHTTSVKLQNVLYKQGLLLTSSRLEPILVALPVSKDNTSSYKSSKSCKPFSVQELFLNVILRKTQMRYPSPQHILSPSLLIKLTRDVENLHGRQRCYGVLRKHHPSPIKCVAVLIITKLYV